MQPTKILVVEDEILLGRDIANRLDDLGYSVIGPVANYSDSKRVLVEEDIDLALIDIKLDGKKDGIDLAQFIQSEVEIPFIFLSSLESQTVVNRAKLVSPCAYLLKPFHDVQVSIAIEVALVNFSKSKDGDISLEYDDFTKLETNALQIKNSLFLKKGQHFERIHLKDILFLEADSNYCIIHTTSDRFIYSTVLKNVEKQLPKDQFLRVHRSFVINIDCVRGFEGNVLFLGTHKIPVSKAFRSKVFKLFPTI